MGPAEQRMCVKQNFQNQNHDLSPDNRRKCELGSCCPFFMIALNTSAGGTEGIAGALNLSENTVLKSYTASHIIRLSKCFTRRLC